MEEPAMESLERMRRLQALRPQRPTTEAAPGRAGGSAPAGARRLDELVPGAVIENEAGVCYLVTQRYDLTETRGLLALGHLLEYRPGLLSPLHPGCGLDGVADFREAAFVDTETTGLGTSAGVYAFMVGVGTFEPAVGEDGLMHDIYVVRQFFMRSPAEEPALLTALADLLRDRSLSVSFNGRAFDLPLLRARYAINRTFLPAPARRVPLLAEEAPQLDLLLPARRLWKRRLQSCRLLNLEAEILGLQRSEDDVPGFLIPQLYIDYVRSGNARSMRSVFYHNREDIVSTTAIASEICQSVGAPDGADRPLCAMDWFSLGCSYEAAGALDLANAAYRRSLEGLQGRDQAEAFRRLADLHKRSGRGAEAAALWELWITSVPGADLTPYIELAKHHEWETRDLATAEMWSAFGIHTARALQPWQRLPGQLADLEHRLDRIRRKRAAAGA